MSEKTRYQAALEGDTLFADIMRESKEGKKAPGYNQNDLVDPASLSDEQQKKLEDWGL